MKPESEVSWKKFTATRGYSRSVREKSKENQFPVIPAAGDYGVISGANFLVCLYRGDFVGATSACKLVVLRTIGAYDAGEKGPIAIRAHNPASNRGGNHVKLLIAGVLADLFAVLSAPGIPHSEYLASSSGGAKDQIYSHNAKGLQKQFEPFLKAVEKGDETKMKESFAIFAVPEPATWFGQYFAKDQIQQLVWDNESEVDTYRTSLNMLLRRFLKGSHYDVRCELNSEAAPTLKPRADAMVPLSEVPIEKFNIRFLGDGEHSMGQLANFAYVDGAFRYLGKGSYPFWSMPDATSKPAS